MATAVQSDPTEKIHLLMPERLVTSLRVVAAANDRTISAEIRRAVRRHLEQEEATA